MKTPESAIAVEDSAEPNTNGKKPSPGSAIDAAARTQGDAGWPSFAYWIRAATAVAIVVLATFAFVQLRVVLLLILASLVIALGMQPGVSWFERRGLRRGWAVGGMMAAFALTVVGFAALIVPIVMEQLASLVQSGPGLLARAQQGNGLIAQLDQQFHLVDNLKQIGNDLPSTAFAVAKSFTALLFVVVTIFILTAYFSVSLPNLRRSIAKLLVREHREEFATILEQATTRIGGYLMGNAVVSVIAGVVTYAGLSVLHVPYALALSLWVALTDLIPTVGAYLGAIPAIVVAAFAGTGQLVGTIVLFAVYQQVENSFIAPHVMKKAINISPALVLISVLVGGALFGPIGAILAVPIAAVIRITLDELYVQDRVEEVKKVDRRERSHRNMVGSRRPFAFRRERRSGESKER